MNIITKGIVVNATSVEEGLIAISKKETHKFIAHVPCPDLFSTTEPRLSSRATFEELIVYAGQTDHL